MATIVVSAVPVPRRRCPSARLLIDRFDLWRNGTHAIWIDGKDVRVESVNGVRGVRPWVIRPDARRRTARPQPDTEPEDAEAEAESALPESETNGP